MQSSPDREDWGVLSTTNGGRQCNTGSWGCRHRGQEYHYACLSGSFILCQGGANSHSFRVFFNFRPMHQNFVPWGGGMCILFEICEKRPFQKCMGWGGGLGGRIFEH